MKKYLEKLYKKDKKTYFKLLENDLKHKHKRFIVTVNPETLMNSQSDEELKEILNCNYISLVPDGIAVVKAARKLGIKVEERITGIDIAEHLLKVANEKNIPFIFLEQKKKL